MNAAEKILKSLKTKEGQAKIDELAEKFIARKEAKNKEIKCMFSSTDYIEWLNKFTQDKNGFSDDDWLYFPEKISDSDRENVGKLNLLYEGIDRYAEQNQLSPEPCKFGNFYRVKLNDFSFEIGILIGQGTVFFFNKVPLEEDKEFIDFKNIMTLEKQDEPKTLIKK